MIESPAGVVPMQQIALRNQIISDQHVGGKIA